MQRYFIQEINIKDNYIIINEDDSHHIKNVMRMKQGDKVLCSLDGKNTYLSEIVALDKLVKLRIIKEVFEETELDVKIVIAQGLISREKTEEVLKKLSEIGAYKYIPINMRRSKYKIDITKAKRFTKIIKEACEQAQRSKLLELDSIKSFSDLEKIAKSFSYKFFVNVGASTKLKDFKFDKEVKEVLFVVGPEGGFDDSEIVQLRLWGFTELNLGKRIMRTETAPVYLASIMAFIYGDKHEN